MKRLALALSVVFAFTVQPALADPQLRTNVVVDGDLVKLGDVFDNIGDKAGTAIARSPTPGKSITVNSAWLVRVARSNGIDWKPLSTFDQVVIERSGVTIGPEQIESELMTALIDQGVSKTAEIELANRTTQMVVPAGSETTIGVREVFYDSRYKRFTATIEVPADSPSAQRVHVSGRVFNTVDVPVLAHSISRGDVIHARDLTWTKVREDSLRRDALIDADQIIGLAPSATMRMGEMLSATVLQRPLAVAKGATVTMVLKVGAMSLTSQGRAIEQGSVGDVIRITNTRSNQTVTATIEGPNMVSVAPNGGVALAN
ncbi:MAG TPA: flagellar basal body P-ring formation chaperone FlgA [Patescibacteria group bacterium]|nr:flagellar basal body P-ring formation chaperone FlgA [Patescibacteria group bacterium]